MGNPITYADGRTPKICIIGAGFSGLTSAIQLKRQLKLSSFVIYDENHDVGGTWLVNTYPGCACDIPSHLYSWSFEPNPDWPHAYSSSHDIFKYMKKVSEKYNLYPHIQFNTEVKETIWNDDKQKWLVTVANKNTLTELIYEYDIVISGTGPLRSPNFPKEFDSFKGTILHSGKYDTSVDLRNKTVGVVGSGASAIQIIPAIAPLVKELHCYQRTSPHVIHRPQKTYSDTFKLFCKYFPPIMWILRLFIFIGCECLHFAFYEDSFLYKHYTKLTGSEGLSTKVKDVNLVQKLVPNTKFGCKRILFHDTYYDALQMPHVAFHKGRIENIQGDQVVSSDGSSTKLDVLILATGFKFSDYLDPLKVIGKGGVNVNEVWKKDKPSAYLGITTYAAPNFFILHGPNTALGHNSVIIMVECQTAYIVEAIREMMSKNVKVILTKKKIEEQYMKDIEIELKKTIWATGKCASWYENPRGDITAIWPLNCITYWWRTRSFNLNNYETY